MVSPEQFPASEDKKGPDVEGVWRIEIRPVEDVRAGKQELAPYTAMEPVMFKPPIAMPIYEEFDAAKSLNDLKVEMAAMKSLLPPNERRKRVRARINEIRERLAQQERGIAEAIRALKRAIAEHPDDNGRALFRRVAELAPKYHFSHNELRAFWDAITLYCEKHAAVKKYRKKFPDDAALFNACFGHLPKGRVEVEQGPASLYFHCYDDDDYAWAYAFDETRGDRTKLTQEMKRRAFATHGVMLPRMQFRELDGSVVMERSGVLLDSQQRALIQTHELQHLMNQFFIPLICRAEEEKALVDVARTAKSVEEGKRAIMEQMARAARRAIGIDNAARDEVLAYYKEGMTPKRIFSQLTMLTVYDYRNAKNYKDYIDALPESIARAMTETMSVVFEMLNEQEGKKMRDVFPLLTHYSEVEPYVQKVFGEDYKKDLRRWIGALEALEKKGYTREEIVSMLYGERVTDWQAFVRRAPEKSSANI